MKNALSLVSAVTLILGIAVALPPNLAAKGNKTAKKQDPVVHDTVTLVTNDSITVAGKEKSKTYAITNFTRIIVNGKSTTTIGIELGMSVVVGADSNGVASLINCYSAPKASAKK